MDGDHISQEREGREGEGEGENKENEIFFCVHVGDWTDDPNAIFPNIYTLLNTAKVFFLLQK